MALLRCNSISREKLNNNITKFIFCHTQVKATYFNWNALFVYHRMCRNEWVMTSINWNGGVDLICEDNSNNWTTLPPSASHCLRSLDSAHSTKTSFMHIQHKSNHKNIINARQMKVWILFHYCKHFSEDPKWHNIFSSCFWHGQPSVHTLPKIDFLLPLTLQITLFCHCLIRNKVSKYHCQWRCYQGMLNFNYETDCFSKGDATLSVHKTEALPTARLWRHIIQFCQFCRHAVQTRSGNWSCSHRLRHVRSTPFPLSC